jgi:DNA-binding transcriptional regulator YdaS (Cro superfamily)
MKLIEWKQLKNISNKDMAKLIGIHFSYVTHILKNRRRPSPDLALKIEQATGGQVTAMELLYPAKK